MAKKPNLIDKLMEPEPRKPRLLGPLAKMDPEQIAEVVAAVQALRDMPLSKRPSQRHIANLMSEHFGLVIGQSTICGWIRDGLPKGLGE